jgi:hypothetical protein
MLFNREERIPASNDAKTGQIAAFLPAVREFDFTPKP